MPAVLCPHCGVKGNLPDAAMGRQARCPVCKNAFAATPTHDDSVIVATEDVGHRPRYGPAERVVILPFLRAAVWVFCLLGMLGLAITFASAGSRATVQSAAETLAWMFVAFAVARGFDAATRWNS